LGRVIQNSIKGGRKKITKIICSRERTNAVGHTNKNTRDPTGERGWDGWITYKT